MRTGHAADGMEQLAANPEPLLIDQLVADVNPLHQPDDQPVPADLQRSAFNTFQTRR